MARATGAYSAPGGGPHLRFAVALSAVAILAMELAAQPVAAAGPQSAMPAPTAAGTTGKKVATALDWVNTYIGTGSTGLGGSDYGGTMPFVTTPFGMTNWTAQTRENRISVSSYAFEDDTISGFIGTHQPAIWMGDYGYVTLTPEVDSVKLAPDARKLRFRRSDEVTTPYYYSVLMDAGDARQIRAEITATDHCGFLRFTFPAHSVASVVVEATRPRVEGFVHIDARASEIVGYNPDRMDTHLINLQLPNFKGYFVVRFNRSFKAHGVYLREAAEPGGSDATGPNVGGYASFDTAGGQVVEAAVGTSFISIEQARANLKAEIPDWNFEAARARLKELWNGKLARFVVEGASDDQRRIFYTGLYHALLYPKLFSEHGRYYSAFDDRVHEGVSYTAYSLWDTFRAENSLLTLIAPERIDDMVRALLQDFKEGGWMPKWPNPSYTNIMIATHADSIVAEAFRKGFEGFDRQLAWQAVYKDAMTPPDGDTTRRWLDREEGTPYEARAGLTYYKTLGYIPTDKTDEASSRTLEDSYDDWCVAQIAKALGRDEDYRFFLHRSLNDRNLYNPAVGLMNGKTSDGAWAPIGGSQDTPENRSVSGWTEGDAWVYTWSPLHDQAGLIQLMGGRNNYAAKLDAHFSGGHNVHSNEPSHHYGYLYDFAGQPWKTQAKVREIAAAEYGYDEGGLDGDDDCGQMSAWLLFTAMGFYPVNPASGDFMIGSPMHSGVSLRLQNGKTFRVEAENVSARNLYVQSAMLDGKPLNE